MVLRRNLLAPICFLASLLVVGIAFARLSVPLLASAHPATSVEARLGAFELGVQARVGVEVSRAIDLPRGCKPTYDELASDSPLAAKGGLGSLGRAGKGRGVREVVGDSGDARKLFDDMRGSNPVTEVKLGVFTAPGANGGTVTFRGTSKSGPPKVDVHGIEDGIRKIKFVDQ